MKKAGILVLMALYFTCAGCVRVQVESIVDLIPPWKKSPKEHKGEVRMDGKEMTLLGDRKKVGDGAPNFKAVDWNRDEMKLKDLRKKVVYISAVPSVDTKVSRAQIRKISEQAAKSPDVIYVVISRDLPQALARFRGEEGIKNVRFWSDHVKSEFGLKYGILMKENSLLARAVFVINKKGKITYIEIVPEVNHEPNYDKALHAIERALRAAFGCSCTFASHVLKANPEITQVKK